MVESERESGCVFGGSEPECVSGLTEREEAGCEEEEAEASNEQPGHSLRIWESSCNRRSLWGASWRKPKTAEEQNPLKY